MSVEPKTLVEMLKTVAAGCVNRPVYRFLTGGNPDGPCETLLAHDLEADAARIGGALATLSGAAGVDKPRVVIACTSPLDFARAFFGCLFAGAIPVPVDPPPARPTAAWLELQRSIQADAQPCLVVTDSDQFDAMRMAVEPQKAGPAIFSVEELLARQARCKSAPISPNDAALIQYTSGSTASPRGVLISHENLLSNLRSISNALQPPPDAAGVCWLPLSHDMGLVGNFLLNLYAGGELVLMTPRAFIESPLQWLRAISRFRAWGTCAPNFAFTLCNRAIRKPDAEQLDLSSLEAVLCGAEPIDPETLDHFLHRFAPQGLRREALRPCYGLAEATLLVSISRPGRFSVRSFDPAALSLGQLQETQASDGRRVVSCGAIQPDLEAIVVDTGSRRPLQDGQVGEIWISGSSVAAGYFGWSGARNREVFQAEVPAGDRRYLRTGDLGAFYGGELFLTGRSKDLVTVRGRNHDAHDLEQVVTSSHPGLRCGQVAVLADIEQGERVVVMVEPPPRVSSAQFPALVRRIRARLVERIGIQPDTVVIVPPKSIAFTSSGKMRRTETLRLLNSGAIQPLFTHDSPDVSKGQPDEAAAWGDDLFRVAFLREVRLAARLSERDRVAWNARLSELGIDSLGLVQLTTSLRQVARREVPAGMIEDDPTLSEILERIRDAPACRNGSGPSHSSNGAPPSARAGRPSEQPTLDLRSRHQLRETSFDDVFEPARRFSRLAATHGAEGMPFYVPFSDWQGTHARLNGRRILILSTFDYLGLASDDRVQSAAGRAAQEFGTGRSGARIHAGTAPEILALERRLAGFLGREDALICTTGYQAMVAVVTTFMNSRTTLVVDEAVHASILDGAAISRCRLVRFRHNDHEDLDAVLHETSSAMVMVEGLYSNDGDVPPLPEIRAACSRHAARLAVDDAHGLGTLGASGRGVEEHFGCLGASDILAGTFSKSLCSIGGWIAGDRDIIEYVRYHGRSILFSAAISPPMVAAAGAALEILTEQPERVSRVRGNAELLRRCLIERAIAVAGEHGPLIRIPIGDELACVRVAAELLSRGIFVQPVLYPSVPRDGAMIRLCVSAAHDPDELRDAAEQFANVFDATAGRLRQEFRASAD